MEKELLKMCPACKNENNASEIMCIKCGSDISYVKAVSKLEIEKEKNDLNIENEKSSNTVPDDEKENFRKVFSEELKSNSRRRTELYPRTKDDEEAEKIIKEIKQEIIKTKDKIGKRITAIYNDIKKRGGN